MTVLTIVATMMKEDSAPRDSVQVCRAVRLSMAAIVHVTIIILAAAIVLVRSVLREVSMVSPVRVATSLVRAVMVSSARVATSPVRVVMASLVRVAMVSSVRAATVSPVPSRVAMASPVRVASTPTMVASPVMASLRMVVRASRNLPVRVRPTTIRMLSTR